MTNSQDKEILTVYRPERELGGLIRTAALAATEISRSRYLIWKLFVRDFKAQFRQKILGYFWAFLTPLLAIASFVILNLSGVLNPGDTGVPYPVYVLVGTSIWGFLTTTVISVSNGLLSQGDLILRTNVPKIALAVSSLAQVAYTVLVNVAILILVLVAFGIDAHLMSPLYLLLIVPVIVTGAAIGLFVSVIGAIARDVVSLVQSGLSLLMYLTPVVYVAKSVQSGLIQTLIWYNPLSYLIDVPRAILLTGTTDLWYGFAVSSGISVLLLLVSIRCFYVMQDLVAERL